LSGGNYTVDSLRYISFINFPGNEIKKIYWTCHVARMAHSIDAYIFCLVIVRKRGRDRLEDPRLELCVIIQWTFRKWNGVKYWIEVVQCRSKYRKHLNAVMNNNDCIKWGYFWTKWETASFSMRTAACR